MTIETAVATIYTYFRNADLLRPRRLDIARPTTVKTRWVVIFIAIEDCKPRVIMLSLHVTDYLTPTNNPRVWNPTGCALFRRTNVIIIRCT